jgi:hypothetical protein
LLSNIIAKVNFAEYQNILNGFKFSGHPDMQYLMCAFGSNHLIKTIVEGLNLLVGPLKQVLAIVLLVIVVVAFVAKLAFVQVNFLLIVCDNFLHFLIVIQSEFREAGFPRFSIPSILRRC